MAREARIFIENACYHIITRGNQRQVVFKNKLDFQAYLSMMHRAKKKYGIRLYAYCLMPNHVHLLIEPGLANNVSLFMHWLNRIYATHFNNTYNKVGHAWQGRFVSRPITKGSYLINCATYIEANPVRACLADDITEYPWTSYTERCLQPRRYLLDEIAMNEWSDSIGTV